MTATKTGIQAENTVTQFANGRELEYTLEEYKSIPKCDREEFVSRLIIANERLKESVTKHNDLLKEANRKAQNANANLGVATEDIHDLRQQLIPLKKMERSVWYKAYKFFNR